MIIIPPFDGVDRTAPRLGANRMENVLEHQQGMKLTLVRNGATPGESHEQSNQSSLSSQPSSPHQLPSPFPALMVFFLKKKHGQRSTFHTPRSTFYIPRFVRGDFCPVLPTNIFTVSFALPPPSPLQILGFSERLVPHFLAHPIYPEPLNGGGSIVRCSFVIACAL